VHSSGLKTSEPWDVLDIWAPLINTGNLMTMKFQIRELSSFT
jgi:hypothetical protein